MLTIRHDPASHGQNYVNIEEMDDLTQTGDRKVIKAQIKPRSTGQMGLGASLGVHPAGTERHMETPRLPTAPAKLFIIFVWSLRALHLQWLLLSNNYIQVGKPINEILVHS